MVSKERVAELVKKFGKDEKDTGSAKVQVALISEQISLLTVHLKAHPKDFHSQRGLQVLVGKRRSLLTYIKNNDLKAYQELIAVLGLRK